MTISEDLSLSELFPELKSIGNTRLIKIFEDVQGGGIFAKCEWENLTASVKDRVAFQMVIKEIKKFPSLEVAKENLHLLEYSGGSLAFSLAKICELFGISLTMVVGDWIPVHALDLLRRKCTNLVVTPKEKGFYQVIIEAKNLATSDSKFTFLNQHENSACLDAHIKTANEILCDIPEIKIDSWVAAIGTGATLMGAGKVLKDKFPQLRINGVTPTEQPYGSQLPPNGMPKRGLGNGLLQKFIAAPATGLKVDKHWVVSFEEAILGTQKFFSEKKILLGSSAAANLLVAFEEYKKLGLGSNVVTVLPSAINKEQFESLPKASTYASIYTYLM